MFKTDKSAWLATKKKRNYKHKSSFSIGNQESESEGERTDRERNLLQKEIESDTEGERADVKRDQSCFWLVVI